MIRSLVEKFPDRDYFEYCAACDVDAQCYFKDIRITVWSATSVGNSWRSRKDVFGRSHCFVSYDKNECQFFIALGKSWIAA